MKKALTVLIAVLLIAVSAMPAFAESVNSPTPTKGNYNINITVSEDIGTATYDFVSGVDENGNQQIHLHIDLNDGVEFGGWVLDAGYVDGDLSKTDTIITISSDAVITAKKAGGEPETTPEPTKSGSGDNGDNGGSKGGSGSKGSTGGKVVDGGSKSPQTGSNDVVTFVAFSALALALASAVVVAKKTSK